MKIEIIKNFGVPVRNRKIPELPLDKMDVGDAIMVMDKKATANDSALWNSRIIPQCKRMKLNKADFCTHLNECKLYIVRCNKTTFKTKD